MKLSVALPRSGLASALKPIAFGSVMLLSVIILWAIIVVEFLHPTNVEMLGGRLLLGIKGCFHSLSLVRTGLGFGHRMRVECEIQFCIGILHPGWSMMDASGALEALPPCTQPR